MDKKKKSNLLECLFFTELIYEEYELKIKPHERIKRKNADKESILNKTSLKGKENIIAMFSPVTEEKRREFIAEKSIIKDPAIIKIKETSFEIFLGRITDNIAPAEKRAAAKNILFILFTHEPY